MTKEHETNTEFIERIMSFGCPTGPLIQPFIIEALTNYSRKVVKNGPEVYDNALVRGEAWHRTAKWLKGELDEKYAPSHKK